MASRDEAGPALDWRDTLRDAADLALVGIAVTVCSLGVVTAGAAVATASAAIHQRYADGSWPDLAMNARRFARAVLPGIGATLAVAVAAALLVVDLWAVRAGAVPGGAVLLAATVVVAVAALGFAGLTTVAVGRTGGRGWWPAARHALAAGQRHPTRLLAVGGTLAVAALLGALIPVTAPILVGYALFATHALTRLGRA